MPSDPFDNNANPNNSNPLWTTNLLQWVLRNEENQLNLNPRHFSFGNSNVQNNILEIVAEEVENAEPNSGFHKNVNTIEVVADVHRSESGYVVEMLVNGKGVSWTIVIIQFIFICK